MNDKEFEAGAFERLLKLPEDDPERVRAERSSRFIAWKHLLEAFESPPDELLTPREQARAEAELAERVARAVAGGRPEPSRRPSTSARASWLDRWTAGGRWAALRPALAIAAVVVVAAVGWWSIDRLQESPAVRGAGDANAVALRAMPAPEGVELRWSAVPGAKMYRLAFFGSDLTERARIDSLYETQFTLRVVNLPVGLTRGGPVLVEVVVVRQNDAIASRPVSIQIP